MPTPFFATLVLAALPLPQAPAALQPRAAQPPPAQAPASAVHSPAAKIDGQPISAAEYAEWLLHAQGDAFAREFAEKCWAIEREAQRVGVELDDERVIAAHRAEMERRLEGAFLNQREDWLAELAATGRSEGGLERQRSLELRPEMLLQEVARLERKQPGYELPEYKIERDWHRYYGRNGRKYDLRLIQVQVVVPSATADQRQLDVELAARAERLPRALELRQRALAGEDFADIARECSDDPESRANGGVPEGGYTHIGKSWGDQFLDALEALAPGEISQPLYTRGGWWLVQVRGVEVTTLEQARPEIEARIFAGDPENDEIEAVRARAVQGLDVRLSPELLGQPSSPEGPGIEPIAMTINGEPVSRATYARWLLHYRGEVFLRNFVETKLLEQRAAELGIEVSDEEVHERAQRYVDYLITAKYRDQREAYLASIALEGRTENSFLYNTGVKARADLLAEKLILAERKITPAMVRQKWVETYGPDGQGRAVRMLRITASLRDVDPTTPPDEVARLQRAELERVETLAADIARRLRGGEDFAALAQRYSDEPISAALGGALQGRYEPSEWSAHLSEPVMKLRAGEWVGPLREAAGLWFFEVTEIWSKPFESVAETLEAELRAAPPFPADISYFRNSLYQRVNVELGPGMYE
jgi:parvulin-like peptidyl-prolyl isomerase